MITKTRIFSFLVVICLCSVLLCCTQLNTSDSLYPTVAYDEINRRYLVVFVKSKTDYIHDESLISGVFIDSTGGPLGGEFAISGGKDDFFCPSLGYDSLHAKFLVVWNAAPFEYAQFIGADGTADGQRLTLSDTAEPGSGRCSALAFDSVQGAFLAAWGEKNASGHDSLFAQLIRADGSLAGPKVLVSDDGARPAWPSVAYDSASLRYLAVWDNAGNNEIKGRFIKPDGSVDAPEFSIYTVGGTERWPKVSYDSVNVRFLVTWEHSEGTFVLQGQLLNSDGTPTQPVFTVSSAGIDVLRHSSVFDPAGKQYLILFGDFAGEHQKIHSQIIPADGAAAFAAPSNDILLSYADFTGDRRPTVAYDSLNQRYFAAWSYGSDDQQFSDIHGRHVNEDGTPSGQIYVLSNGGVWP